MNPHDQNLAGLIVELSWLYSRSAPASPSHIGMSGLVTPESLSREGSPVPEYVDSATASPLNPLNTAAQYDVNTTSAPPSPPHPHQQGMHTHQTHMLIYPYTVLSLYPGKSLR